MLIRKFKQMKENKRKEMERERKENERKEREYREKIKKEEKLKKEKEEEKELRKEAIKQIKDEFLEKEGISTQHFSKDYKIDYQEAKQFLLRNGFNWSDLKRMNKYKILFEANSLVEYKAYKEDVLIVPIRMFLAESTEFGGKVERK